MKRIFRYLLMMSVAAVWAITGSSCTDYLDKSEDSDISEDIAFRDFANFQGYTEMLYTQMPDFCRGYWTNSFNWGDDEVISADVNYHMVYKIDNGDFWGWQSEYDGWGTGWLDRGSFDCNSRDRFKKGLWPAAWWSIRHANMGLANLDLLTDATPAQKKAIEGQLLFFRGWYHFMLIQYFGGLPYIDKVLDANAQINEPRLTYRECADKCAADFRRAADLLPIDWDAENISPATKGKNDMRVNKVTALAYLGKNYLWAASPLMNATNQGRTDYTACPKTYDKEYSQKAAEALGELLALVEGGQTQYSLVPFDKITDVFYTYGQGGNTPGSTEAILRNCASDGYNGCRWGWLLQYTIYPYNVGGCKLSACANYVNYYGMANGEPIYLEDGKTINPDSGFDPTHPWLKRDPRFYTDFRFDGCFMSENSKCAATDTENNPTGIDLYNIPLYTGSPSRDVNQGCRTGYMLLKYQSIDCNDFDDGYGWSPHINAMASYMRLADVYLMYAEAAATAANSANGSFKCNLTAADAINKIRDRAGVTNIKAKYTGDMEKFMSEVRRERAVELSYEGHRFNDLRRWLLLTEPRYADKTSQEFDRAGKFNADAPDKNQVSNFHEEVIVHRSYENKHYWLPLKKKDVNMSASFPQNPGW